VLINSSYLLTYYSTIITGIIIIVTTAECVQCIFQYLDDSLGGGDFEQYTNTPCIYSLLHQWGQLWCVGIDFDLKLKIFLLDSRRSLMTAADI